MQRCRGPPPRCADQFPRSRALRLGFLTGAASFSCRDMLWSSSANSCSIWSAEESSMLNDRATSRRVAAPRAWAVDGISTATEPCY